MKTAKAISVSVTSIRAKLRRAAEESDMTQEEIGLRMGFSKESSRRAVSRLLNLQAEHDPRLSTLLAFADAIRRPLKDLL
jgi:transcriptional regulator with XRE-family HTH domain